MARSVSVSMLVKTGDTNKNLIKVLNHLNNIKSKITEIGSQDIKINVPNIASFKSLEQAILNNTKALSKFKDVTKTVNDSVNNTSKVTKNATGSMKEFAGSLAFIGMLKSKLPTFLKFEDAIYNLGIVSKLSVGEIENLKNVMLKLSAGLPQSATELTMATDVIVRTGQTLPSALMVVENASKLATASGESLANTVQIVNKILVAMGIEADKAGVSMQTLHSVSINTATDLAKVGQASKYWASALSVFSGLSGRAGEELDAYKQQLFDFGAVTTGILANLGRDSTMAGTGIRTLASKMVRLESTARDMLNKDLVNSVVRIDMDTMKMSQDGVQLTADMLSEMSVKDLPKAINLLSELFSKGKISLQTINKMFTTRQGLALAGVLQTINGNWEEYADKIKTASNLTEDFEKQTLNLNNQLGTLRSKLLYALKDIGTTAKESMGVLALGMNSLLDLFNKMPNSMQGFVGALVSIGTLTPTIAILTKSFGTLFKTITGISSMAQLGALISNPYTLAIGAVIGLSVVISKVISHTRKLKEEQLDYIRSLEDSKKRLEETKEKLKATVEINEKLKSYNIDNPWTDLNKSLKEYSETLKGVSNLYNNFGDLNLGNTIKSLQSSIDEAWENSYKTQMGFATSKQAQEAKLLDLQPYFDERGKLLRAKSELERQREELLALYESKDVLSDEDIRIPSIVSNLNASIDKINIGLDKLNPKLKEYEDIKKGLRDLESLSLEDTEKAIALNNELIENLLSYADQMNASINSVKTGLVDKMLIGKNFSSTQEMFAFINKLDSTLYESISKVTKLDKVDLSYIKDNVERAKALMENEKVDILKKYNLQTLFLGGGESLVKSADLMPLISLADNVSDRMIELTEKINKATNKGVKQTFSNEKEALGGILKLIQEYVNQINELSDSKSKEITLPYINLNSELQKAIYNLKTFGKTGEELFKAQKKETERLYRDISEKQLATVLDVGATMNYKLDTIGVEDLDILENKLKSLKDIANPTKEDKASFEGYLKLYNEIDKYLSEEVKHKLELLKIEKEKKEYIYKTKQDEIKYNSSINKLISKQSTMWDSSYSQKHSEFSLLEKELNDRYELAYFNNDDVEMQKLKLEYLELHNSKLEEQKGLYMEIAGHMTNALTSISKGEMPKFDMMGGFTKGLAEFGMRNENEEGFSFGDMSAEGQLGIIGGSIQLLDNFMSIGLDAEMKSLQYEQEILAIRMQGATTEEEKQKILEQQLQMQKEAIDLQYKQQTSFMGMGGNTATAGASGALTGAMSGATIGAAMGSKAGPWGAAIGAAVGLIGGISSANSAKRQAERQKEALEYQRRMTEHLEEVKKQVSTSNTYMKSIATDSAKIGLINAQQKVLTNIAMNPQQYKVGGMSDVAFNDRIWRGGFKRRFEDNWVSLQAQYGLSDFGYEATDLQDIKKVSELRLKIAEQMKQYEWTESGYDVTKGFEVQARANYLALQDMLNNIGDIADTYYKLGRKSFNQYFGGALEEIKDEGGKVTDFFVDWSDYLSTQFSKSREESLKSSIVNSRSITEQFLSGISNMYIQNYSNISSVIDDVKSLYESLSEELAKNSSEINIDFINKTMDELITKSNDYVEAQKQVNTQVNEFLNTWLEKGGKLTDIYDSMTDSMKSIYDSISSNLRAEDYSSMAENFGKNIGDKISDSMIQTIIDAKYSQAFADLNNSLMTAIETQSIGSISNLLGYSNAMLARMENDRRQMEAISSLFDYDRSIDYVNQNQNIQYQTGTTKDVVNNYNYATEINVDNMFATEENWDDLAYTISSKIANNLDRTK